MTKREQTYLKKAAAPDGFIDRSQDYATISALQQRGLVVLTEKLVMHKGVGLAPAPHLTITSLGRTVLAAL